MEKYLLTAKTLKTIGLKGEIKIYSYTTFPDLRYKKGSVLYYKKDEKYLPLEVLSSSFKGGEFYQIKFKNIDSIEEAQNYLSLDLYSLKDESILFENEFFYDDLLGLEVFNEENVKIGTIKSIEEFPAQITLNVQKTLQKSTFFVPFNDFFVKKIDLENKKIVIHIIEGLLD